MSVQTEEYPRDEHKRAENFQDTLGLIIGFVMRQYDAVHIEPSTQVWERIVGHVAPPKDQRAA